MLIRIGSRGSDLALWQANHIKKQLENLGASVTITIIKTKGDAIQNLSFDKLEGKGFFTKEIEEALLNHEIDLAVHSHKDLETTQPAGLHIACVSEREDPADLLLINPNAVDEKQTYSLKKGAIVGTSSARRKAQLVSLFDEVEIKDIRGNVPTRIQKLSEGQFDAILLAKAGVDRLQINLDQFNTIRLDPVSFVPAPAQGVLALQIRKTDTDLNTFLQAINHPDVQSKIAIERKVLQLMKGGCQLPLGVYCDDDCRIHVAFAQKWETGAIFNTYESEDLEHIAETIVHDLNSENANEW
jgi:hydroxymethylbilane synthase